MRSPDLGDALALTFAHPVAPRGIGLNGTPVAGEMQSEYDPFN